jgi:hypothetical protein
VSPDHALLLEGVLVPAGRLVDGATIARDDGHAVVTYLHVELDRHDIILAENCPAESYLDAGNRAAFENGGGAIQLHPDFTQHLWDADACAPLVLAGPRLAAIRRRLLARAAAPNLRHPSAARAERA